MEMTNELQDPIELATKVYEGLSDQEIEEIERIAFSRNAFFFNPAPYEPESSR